MIKKSIDNTLCFLYPLVKKILPYQVYAYLTVGAANTALNIGLFLISYQLLQQWWLAVEIATVTSFVVTVLTGFWLNKNFAFSTASKGKKETQKQFGKYLLVALQGQFSDYLITKGLVVILLMNPSIAYLLSTVIMLVLNYFLQKYFTFRSRKVSIS